MDKPYEDMKEHTPSFFKNSSPGNHAFLETKRPTEETDEVVTGGSSASSALVASDEEIYARRQSVAVGGFTCCVPGCFSNSKRDTNLSFYNIPNGKSKDKQLLRKKWLHAISRKDFRDPGLGHRVCSKHFVGGRKSYMNNVPTIVPKTENKKTPKERPTKMARNREDISCSSFNCVDEESISTLEPLIYVEANHCRESSPNEIASLEARILELELENKTLKESIQQLHDTVNAQPKQNFSLDDIKLNKKNLDFIPGLLTMILSKFCLTLLVQW